MKYHPASLMLFVWAGCIAAFFILPFQLEGRVMPLYGFLILALFIATFCVGAFSGSPIRRQQPRRTDLTINFLTTDRILMAAGVVAVLALALDVQGRNIFDLADAYQVRSDRAGALLIGGRQTVQSGFRSRFCHRLLDPCSSI